jgi:hypothetical protein
VQLLVLLLLQGRLPLLLLVLLLQGQLLTLLLLLLLLQVQLQHASLRRAAS